LTPPVIKLIGIIPENQSNKSKNLSKQQPSYSKIFTANQIDDKTKAAVYSHKKRCRFPGTPSSKLLIAKYRTEEVRKNLIFYQLANKLVALFVG
jgi:hypothetical protein